MEEYKLNEGCEVVNTNTLQPHNYFSFPVFRIHVKSTENSRWNGMTVMNEPQIYTISLKGLSFLQALFAIFAVRNTSDMGLERLGRPVL